jgi:hypothetical protein
MTISLVPVSCPVGTTVLLFHIIHGLFLKYLFIHITCPQIHNICMVTLVWQLALFVQILGVGLFSIYFLMLCYSMLWIIHSFWAISPLIWTFMFFLFYKQCCNNYPYHPVFCAYEWISLSKNICLSLWESFTVESGNFYIIHTHLSMTKWWTHELVNKLMY